MMTNDLMLGGVYILMAIMLVLGSLMARREPIAKLITMTMAWIVDFRRRFRPFHVPGRLRLPRAAPEGRGDRDSGEQGLETRIPMAIDGHFWVNAKLNGRDVKFLVDSGATMTTIDRDTARETGVEVSPRRDEFVRTGNGIIRVSSGRADELSVGGIVRNDVGLQVADNDDLNVLGMNYLSTLKRWGVEGRWLILVS